MARNYLYAMFLAITIISGLAVFSGKAAYSHTFSGDESASFLTLIEQIKAQVELTGENLSNVTLSKQHAEHAVEHLDEHTIEEISEKNERLGRDLPAAISDLHDSVGNATDSQIQTQIQNINDLLEETISVRVERDQLSNSTVQALVLANMVDSVLEHYSAASGIEPEDHHDEQENNVTESGNGMEDHSQNQTTTDAQMSEMAHYNSARLLAERTQGLYEDKVRSLAPANSTEAIEDLDAGFANLVEAIGNEESNDVVQTIAHTEVHPNIQKAYNLQVIPEFPMPLLTAMVALASVIAGSRFVQRRQK